MPSLITQGYGRFVEAIPAPFPIQEIEASIQTEQLLAAIEDTTFTATTAHNELSVEIVEEALLLEEL